MGISLKLTSLQRCEIIGKLEIRLDTILDDPDSADEFETEESLGALREKIEHKGEIRLTDAESQWVITELKDLLSADRANANNDGFGWGIKQYGGINSLQRVVDKLSSARI